MGDLPVYLFEVDEGQLERGLRLDRAEQAAGV
jgi:hypothetical protein